MGNGDTLFIHIPMLSICMWLLIIPREFFETEPLVNAITIWNLWSFTKVRNINIHVVVDIWNLNHKDFKLNN